MRDSMFRMLEQEKLEARRTQRLRQLVASKGLKGVQHAFHVMREHMARKRTLKQKAQIVLYYTLQQVCARKAGEHKQAAFKAIKRNAVRNHQLMSRLTRCVLRAKQLGLHALLSFAEQRKHDSVRTLAHTFASLRKLRLRAVLLHFHANRTTRQNRQRILRCSSKLLDKTLHSIARAFQLKNKHHALRSLKHHSDRLHALQHALTVEARVFHAHLHLQSKVSSLIPYSF